MRFRMTGLILFLNTVFLYAGAPVVENVRFEQRTDGTLLVDIYYDATDADGDLLEVIIEASNDNGTTWTVPCSTLTGDIGKGITSGTGKHVVWDFYADNPNTSGNGYRVRVTAQDVIVDVDGNYYYIVTIGNQEWMAENLRVMHYRNGDPVPNVTDLTEWASLASGARCAYDNNETGADTYGYLYNWYAVDDSRKIAPAGWHVPTDAEWKELEMALGMSQSQADECGWRRSEEGGKLKETGTTHWDNPNEGATNASGFSALPGGQRSGNFGYLYVGSSAYFWSSTQLNRYGAWYRQLDSGDSDVGRFYYDKQFGFSVRCVRDVTGGYLDVSPSSLNLNSTSNSQSTFTVSSNISWNISENVDWLTVTPQSGSNTGTVTVEASSSNSSTSSRSAIITITGTGGETKTVSITQEAKQDADQYITVTNPVAFASWPLGSTQYITWESNFSASVKIELYKDNHYYKTLKESTKNDGNKIWSIPRDYEISDNYKIKIISTIDPSIYGYSAGFFSLTPAEVIPSTVTDIDGNVYQTVIIGNQVWLAENLRVTRYRNGDEIRNVTDNIEWSNLTTGARCANNNNETNADTYGYLYNGYAVDDSRNIAPEGWHVPTDAEWQIFIDYLGGESVAGGKMKETGTTHWQSPNAGATNESGFSALPAACRFAIGYFGGLGGYACFWSATKYSSGAAWIRCLYNYSSDVDNYGSGNRQGYSIRLVRD